MKSTFEIKAVRSKGGKGAAALFDGCQSLCMSKNITLEVELVKYEAQISNTSSTTN